MHARARTHTHTFSAVWTLIDVTLLYWLRKCPITVTVQASGSQNCRSITVYINIDLAFKPQFMVPSFSYVARGYKLGVWIQDLVSERDQSWVTGDAILHTLIIPQFGKNTTCALHVLFNQQRSVRFHCAVKFAMCGVTIVNFCLCPKIINRIAGIMVSVLASSVENRRPGQSMLLWKWSFSLVFQNTFKAKPISRNTELIIVSICCRYF